MQNTLTQAVSYGREKGIYKLFKRGGKKVINSLAFSLMNPVTQQLRFQRNKYLKGDINLCVGPTASSDFIQECNNVFVAIEAPAVVEDQGWVDPSLEYDAEISFGNFYELDQFYCPRNIYSIFDYFVEMDVDDNFSRKSQELSLVYSNKKKYEGHKLRHRVAEELGTNQLDYYGAGAGNYIENKIDSLGKYMFQIVIENDKHPNYVSEKFFDCIKTNTIPIYWGGKSTVKKLGFDTDSIFFFESIDNLNSLMQRLSAERYSKLRPSVEYNRERLIEIRNQVRFNLFSEPIYYQFAQNSEGTKESVLWLERANI